MNGNFAFNHDLVVQSEIKKIIEWFNITQVIETGTYIGYSTSFFSDYGCDVQTIEINKQFYDTAVNNLKIRSNVKCHLGSSEELLPSILESLPKKLTLFYLDAHWEDNWPLLKEIEIIGKYFKDNNIIVIDDFYVPNRKLQYDMYKGIKNDMDMIKDVLPYAYSDYVYYYNDRSDNKSNLYMKDCYGVGKIYLFPKHLISNVKDNFFVEQDGIFYSKL